MRSLPIQCGTFRIASGTGELKDISVTGFAKARTLWIFRNFSILDFSVLNNAQRQFIAREWHAGVIAAPAVAPAEDDEAFTQLIGTIEGFPKKLYQPPLVAAAECAPPQPEVRLAGSLRVTAFRVALGVLLLGCAISLGPRLRWAPQSTLAGASATNVGATGTAQVVNSRAATPYVAGSDVASAEIAAPKVAPPNVVAATAAHTSVAVASPAHVAIAGGADISSAPIKLALGHSTPAHVMPTAMAPMLTVASHGSVSSPLPVQPATKTATVAALHAPAKVPPTVHPGAANLPAAMANNAAAPTVAPSAPVAASTVSASVTTAHTPDHSSAHPFVLIRVTVDSQGQPQGLQLLQGDKKKIAAAMESAKHWPYQPCSGSSDCAHLMKFTYFGDTSVVTMMGKAE